MNEEKQEDSTGREEPVVVVVIDTLDKTEKKMVRRRVTPELDRWADLFASD